MTRQKKEKELVRSHLIALRVSDVEYEMITETAKEAGLSASAYIRKMLLEGNVNVRYEVVADIEEIQKLVTEFARIGNNLNQISKFFHMGGARSIAMQAEISKCITELHDLREEMIRLAGDFSGNH